MNDIEVRPYEARDRSGVRNVCFETGHMGEPVSWQWRDAESFADMWVGWYTDHEPESAWVVDLDGRVVGYLVGCRDTRQAADPGRIAGRHVLRRGLLFRPGTAGVLWRALFDVVRDRGIPAMNVDLVRWPAHLHINLVPDGRGHGTGRRLMVFWLGALREAGIPGVHLGTFAENARGIAFFEAMGFRRHGDPEVVPGFRSREGGRLHTQAMVQDLD